MGPFAEKKIHEAGKEGGQKRTHGLFSGTHRVHWQVYEYYTRSFA